MASRISIPSLLTPDLTMQTVPAAVENASRPQTPPQQDTSLSTNGICHHADVEPCSDTTSHATAAVHSLLSPAELTSASGPTLQDVFSVQTLQPSLVMSSSVALPQQMFDGYGSLGPPNYCNQTVPPCYCDWFINFLSFKSLCDQQLLDVSSLGNYEPASLYSTCNCYGGWHPDYTRRACKPLEDSASGTCFMETSHPEAYFTGACLSSAASVYGAPFELFHPWTHGLDAQPVLQQVFVPENGDNWDVTGEQYGVNTVSAPFLAGQITSLDS